MQLQIISDIHLNFHNDGGDSFLDSVPVKANYLILAGDISEHKTLIKSLHKVCARWNKVILVLGNHDYYGSSVEETRKLVLRYKPKNCEFLYNEKRIIDGMPFFGGTMWFRHDPRRQKAGSQQSRNRHHMQPNHPCPGLFV